MDQADHGGYVRGLDGPDAPVGRAHVRILGSAGPPNQLEHCILVCPQCVSGFGNGRAEAARQQVEQAARGPRPPESVDVLSLGDPPLFRLFLELPGHVVKGPDKAFHVTRARARYLHACGCQRSLDYTSYRRLAVLTGKVREFSGQTGELAATWAYVTPAVCHARGTDVSALRAWEEQRARDEGGGR